MAQYIIFTMFITINILGIPAYGESDINKSLYLGVLSVQHNEPSQEALRIAPFDPRMFNDAYTFLNRNHFNMVNLAAIERKHTLSMNIVIESGWMLATTAHGGFRFGLARPVRYSQEAISRNQQGVTTGRYQRTYNQYQERKFIDLQTNKVRLPRIFVISYVFFPY